MAYWLVSMASKVSTISPAVGVDLRDRLRRYAFVAAFVSSVGQLVSIFVAHTALAAACVGLVASKERIRVPPIATPLVGFVSWTLLSLAFSDDPAAGWPQVRKLLVFLTLPVVYSLFRTMSQVQRLLEALFVAMLASSLTALGQFAWKAGEAYVSGQSFYYSYVGRRITGFFSHWMTFSQVLMLVALILASYLLFSQKQRWRGRGVWLGVGAVLGVVLLLSYTRSTWAATLGWGRLSHLALETKAAVDRADRVRAIDRNRSGTSEAEVEVRRRARFLFKSASDVANGRTNGGSSPLVRRGAGAGSGAF